MPQSCLVLGHSHVNCLARALQETAQQYVEIINIRHRYPSQHVPVHPDTGLMEKDYIRFPEPDLLCVCVGGNAHNYLGLLEHPQRFSIGDARKGALPPDPERWFIPHHVVHAAIVQMHGPMLTEARTIYESFPRAKRLYLCSPPPLEDWEHIKKYPGPFADKLHLGPPPNELRIRLYEIQTKIFESFAESVGAAFIRPEGAVNEHGFLKDSYVDTNPTHGNTAYGRLMLEKILAIGRDMG